MSENKLISELTDIKDNTVVVIAGPTASGKSGLALEIAIRYNGVVINADAMQVYRKIPVITAAPTVADRQKAEHQLYEIFEPDKNGSVAEWLPLAAAAIKEVWQRNKLPVVVGGTGFYIESLVGGVSPIPETGAETKERIAAVLADGGTAGAYELLQKIDPAGAAMVKAGDTTRVRRALEIFTDTGKSIAEWFKQPLVRPLPDADFRIIPLLPPLDILEDRCSRRFDEMMSRGALEEVEALLRLELPDSLPAMKAIGVPELKDYLCGKCSLKEAVAAAKLHTRQYAKRQLTWFRNRLRKLPAEIVAPD